MMELLFGFPRSFSVVVNTTCMKKSDVIPMSNLLQKDKLGDWIVVKSMYNIAEDNIDVGSRITSTTHKISNLSEIPENLLKHGSIVDGFLTNDMFHITSIKK
jgi:hypothetical protein